MKKILIFLIISFFLIQYVEAEEYILKKGDALKISVWGEGDLEKEVSVDEDGTITYSLIGKVKATGLSIPELDEIITSLLKKDYFVNPDVTIMLAKQVFFITGEVSQPGVHDFAGKIGPIQAIAIAGGLTDFASHTIEIIRQVDDKQEKIIVNINNITDKDGQINEEYLIKHNDVIVIPRSFF